ncbi:MAG: cell division protein SepF [Clostridia bacterium]|nr:cell division protein SepF [Clostridia bacterium]
MSNFMNKMLNFVGFETDEAYDEEYYNESQEQPALDYEEPMVERLSSRNRSRVVKLHETASQQMKVVVMQPETFDEAQAITNHLKARKPVVVNLECIDKNVARRIIDFLSGAAFALEGDIQKISNGIFLIAPNNIGIMSDENIDAKGGFGWGN